MSTLSSISILIVSGSNDFNHVKSSLQFQAEDYLLKPINPIDMLKKVELILEKRQKDLFIRNRQAEQEHLFHEMLPDLRNQFFRSMLLNQYSQLQIVQSRMEFLGLTNKIPASFAVVMLQVSTMANYKEPSELILLLQVLHEHEGLGMTLLMDGDEVILISPLTDGLSKLAQDLSIFQQYIEENMGIELVIGIGAPISDVMNLSHSYQCARLAVNHFQRDKNNLTLYNDIKKLEPAHIHIAKDEELLLFQAIQSGDDNHIIKTVDSIFSRFLQGRDDVNLNFSGARLEWIGTMIWLLKNLELDGEEGLGLNWLELQIGSSCTQVKKLRRWVLDKTLGMRQHLMSERGNRAQRIVMLVKEAVDKRYDEQVNVQQFADEINISPNYLSTLFKQTLNISFTDYIRNVRMNHAVELMRNSTFRIADIALKVGYEDQNYFARVFRKQYGVSPSEYREKV